VRPLETDLATIQGQVDKLVAVEGVPSWVGHFEFQASADPELVARLHWYNVTLQYRHGQLVETMLVLLRQEADAAELTGHFERPRLDGSVQSAFHCTVTRVWEQDVESILGGELAWLPLAPLARVALEELPGVLRRMEACFTREASLAETSELWTVALLLAGLRYTPEVSASLFQGVRAMRESSTYQAILAEGRAEGEARGEARGGALR
jgi:hypothetical protein